MDLSATSEELMASIQNISKAIETVAVTNNDLSNGASTIAEKSKQLFEQVEEVTEKAHLVKNSAEASASRVSKFLI